MAKFIYNNSESTKTYQGRDIGSGEFYQIPENLLSEYKTDASLIADLALSVAKMSATGTEPLSVSASQHVEFLLATLAQDVKVTSQPEPAPFATPAYRTKRSKNSAWVTCPAGEDTIIDFQMTSELYAHGGMFMYKNAKEGDYISAEVYDKDEVIPSPYRTALCEAWPSVAKYIVGAWLVPTEGYLAKEEDTYPLNAKISAGLYLRITYHATSEAGDRKAAINYFLTKKL